MYRIRFRNGVGAAGDVLLADDQGVLLEFEDKDEAKAQLDDLARKFGTVDDAQAWIDGDRTPTKFSEASLAAAEEPEPEPEAEPEPEEPVEEPEATPAAAELADEKGVDLTEVEGSGVGGKVTKADVEKAAGG